MARTPKKAAIQPTATSAGIINAVIKDASGYLAGAPLASDTVDSIRQVGDYILGYQPRANAFFSTLVNRIALVLISSRTYQNPWSFMKKGIIDFGESIEEIFVDLTKAEDFKGGSDRPVNDILADLFKKRPANVLSAFHAMNYQKKYVTSISDDQMRTAFTAADGMTNLVERIVETLTTSMNFDEYLVMKYLLWRTALDGKIKAYTVPDASVSEANAKAVVKTIKEISNDLTFMKTDKNIANVFTHTPKDAQYVIETTKFDAVLNVDVLAAAFNMDRVTFAGKQLLVDKFTAKELERLSELLSDEEGYVAFTADETALIDTIQCFIVDEGWFMIYDNLLKMVDTGMLPNDLSMSYFLHTWKTFSISPFKNCVLLTTSESAINTVTVSPAAATVSAGGLVNLVANIDAAGFASQDVTWSCTEGGKIDAAGHLVVDADATGTITVTATSVANTAKTGRATITIA